MKSYAIGVVVAGVAAWFGTLDAQAQGINITVTGPTAIYTDTSTIEFTGTVSGYNDYNFRLWVYLNGTVKHDSMTLAYSGSNATYYVYNANTWGMQAGNEIKIRVRVWVTSSIIDQEFVYLTVQQGSQTYLQPTEAPRRTPAGGAGMLYAAVVRSNDDQELVA